MNAPVASLKSIFVAAGHSNADPGAIAQGRREADIAVRFRNIVSFYLQQMGVPHELDGKGTSNYPLAVSAASAKRHPLAVEFHCNAGARTASGVEALSAPKDAKLAQRICDAVARVLDIPNRGAKPENAGQHHRLAFVQAGGIIVELFFLTHPRDLALYEAREWLAGQAVARVLAEAAGRPK